MPIIRPSLRTQILVLPFVAALGLAFIAAIDVMNLRAQLLQAHRVQIQSLTEAANNIAVAWHAKAQSGEIPEADAKAAALAAIGDIRYDGDNYLFVNALDGILLMHPFHKDEIGKNVLGRIDPAGTPTYKSFIAAAQRGGGFVDYVGSRPGTENANAPKLAHIALFAPWGWSIGTGVYVDDVDSETWHAVLRVGVYFLAVLAVVVGFTLAFAWRLSRNMRAQAAAMNAVASGDMTHPLEGLERTDELGEMARALEVFKGNAARRVELEAEQNREIAVRAQRHDMVERLARDFDSKVHGLLAGLGDAIGQMQQSAGVMSRAANETSSQAGTVSRAADDAAGNVETVAAASEELAASQAVIAQQVQRGCVIANDAVTQVRQVNETVIGLSTAAQRIGEVVGLINTIAAQTNLLALNATIEAARAGDAGKGFAVVAGEVKTLANQTARATEDIGIQVQNIQDVSRVAAEAIGNIAQTIESINDTSTAISEAVSQQQSATREIAHNVHEAAVGTTTVSASIATVRETASTTGANAAQVLDAARHLANESARLRGEVEAFLSALGDAEQTKPARTA